MKIGFHLENLTVRGTTVAVRDYAYYNKTLLNNESMFFYNKSILDNNDINCNNKWDIFNDIKNNYDIIEYADIPHLEEIAKKYECDYVYFMKSGINDNIWLKNTKSLIHCVFNFYQPHGYKYAYISDWLATAASANKCLSVPYIVTLPNKQINNWRYKLQIKKDSVIIGRYGGFDQFDIEFVKQLISFIITHDNTIIFVFVNTRKFIDHPNVIFVDSITEKQDKTDFILSCDAMIHARSDGESFGLSIGEFLYHNKPVISFGSGRDKNNVQLLSSSGLIFYNQYQLLELIFKLKYKLLNKNYRKLVKQFSPENVMFKFNEVFLND